jgi:hypothetical protein
VRVVIGLQVTQNHVMATASLAPLIEYCDRRFDSIESDMAALEEGFRTLQGRVEAFANRADAFSRDMPASPQAVHWRQRKEPRA